MLIIHGDDTVSSNRRLTEIIQAFQDRHEEFLIKDAENLSVTELRQISQPTNLFGQNQKIIIKNLLGSSKGKHKEGLIDLLTQSLSPDITIFENKKISETGLKPFSKATIESFNVNVVIFKFMDMIRPGNQKSLLAGWNRLMVLNHEPEYVFSMIVRQIRLLIQAKSGPSYLKLSPYPKKLTLAQSAYFELSHLLDLYQKLYEIDKKIKTGTSSLSIDEHLVHFLLQI